MSAWRKRLSLLWVAAILALAAAGTHAQVFQHPRLQPLAQQPQHLLIRNALLDQLYQLSRSSALADVLQLQNAALVGVREAAPTRAWRRA